MSDASVLLVDSDASSVQRLRSIFSSLPFTLIVATSRREALVTGLQQRFSLALIAHGLSDGSGADLLQKLSVPGKQLTGVLLSYHANLTVIQQAFSHGFHSVLQQPVSAIQILELLKLQPQLSEHTDNAAPPDDIIPFAIAGAEDTMHLDDVASLSLEDVSSRLSTPQLIRIIRSVEYHFTGKERLEYFDRDTLERVVLLIRRWSRLRLARRTVNTAAGPANAALRRDVS